MVGPFKTRRFFVIRHGYIKNSKCILEISSSGIGLLSLSLNAKETYEVAELKEIRAPLENEQEIQIKVRKTTETLYCSQRAEILYHLYSLVPVLGRASYQFLMKKWGKTGESVAQMSASPYTLTAWSLNKIDASSKEVLSSLAIHHLLKIERLSDDPDGMVLFSSGNTMVRMTCTARDDFITRLMDVASNRMGINLHVESALSSDYLQMRDVRSMPPPFIVAVSVEKIGQSGAKPRRLALAEMSVIQLCPDRDVVLKTTGFTDIFRVVRYAHERDKFAFELSDNKIIRFSCDERDIFICNLLELMSLNNLHCVLIPEETSPGRRVGGLGVGPGDAEFDDALLRRMAAPPPDRPSWIALVQELNANLNPQSTTVKEKKPLHSLFRLLHENAGEGSLCVLPILNGIERLMAFRVCFEELPHIRGGVQVLLSAVGAEDDAVAHGAARVLIVAVKAVYARGTEKAEKAEMMNKLHILDDEATALVSSVLKRHVSDGSRPLTATALLELLENVLHSCSESTDNDQFDRLAVMVQEMQMDLLFFCQSPCLSLAKNASLLLKVLLLDTPPEIRKGLQNLFRNSGAILWQLYLATNSPSRVQRGISETISQLLFDDNERSMELLRGIIPASLLASLNVPWSESDSATLRRRSVRTFTKDARAGFKQTYNWALFWKTLSQNSERSELIWDNRTRDELTSALLAEIQSFAETKRAMFPTPIEWNDGEFEVRYPSLENEIKVGRFYLRIVLRDGFNVADIQGAGKFMGQLYHRFLTERSEKVRVMCLRAMSLVYNTFHVEPFDTHAFRCLVENLSEMTATNPDSKANLVRDSLLRFFAQAFKNKVNARTFLRADGVGILLKFLTALHAAPETSSSNLTQFSRNSVHGSVKEDYVDESEDWREYDEAFGSSGLCLISLRLLTLLANVYPSVSEVSGAIVRPVPMAKQVMTSSTSLRHLANVLLSSAAWEGWTGASGIGVGGLLVCRAVKLLDALLEHNKRSVIIDAEDTGIIYYLLLLHPPTNLVPVARLLLRFHRAILKFNVGADPTAKKENVLQRLLPECMLVVLDRKGPASFADKFSVGSNDPESVWDEEMLFHLQNNLTRHVQPACEELSSNRIFLGPHTAAPVVTYDCLSDLEWVAFDVKGQPRRGYFLRTLVDEVNFPTWPVEHPEPLLDAILTKISQVESSSCAFADQCLLLLRSVFLLFKRFSNLPEFCAFSGIEIISRIVACRLEKWGDSTMSRGGLLESEIDMAVKILEIATSTSVENVFGLLRSASLATISAALKRIAPALLPAPAVSVPISILTGTLLGALRTLSNVCMAVATVKESSRDGSILTTLAEGVKELGVPLMQCVGSFHASEELFEISTAASDCVSKLCTAVPSVRLQFCEMGSVFLLIYNFVRDPPVKEEDNVAAAEAWRIRAHATVGALSAVLARGSKLDEFLDTDVFGEALSAIEIATNTSRKQALVLLGRPLLSSILKKHDEFISNFWRTTTESLFLIWDESSRGALSEYLRSVLMPFISGDENLTPPADWTEFKFENTRRRLFVGGIYLDVFNSREEIASAPLPNAPETLRSLLTHTRRALALYGGKSELKIGEVEIENYFLLVGNALSNICRFHSGIDTIAREKETSTIISVFKTIEFPAVRIVTATLLRDLCQNEKCVSEILQNSTAEIVAKIIQKNFAASPADDLKKILLEFIFELCKKSEEAVTQFNGRAGLLFLLKFINDAQTSENIREKSAAIIAMFLASLRHGQNISNILSKFIPSFLLASFNEKYSSVQAVEFWQKDYDSPEKRWNENCRREVAQDVEKQIEKYFETSPDAVWTIGDYTAAYLTLQESQKVCGYFLEKLNEHREVPIRRSGSLYLELGRLLCAFSARAVSEVSAISDSATSSIPLDTILTTLSRVLFDYFDSLDHAAASSAGISVALTDLLQDLTGKNNLKNPRISPPIVLDASLCISRILVCLQILATSPPYVGVVCASPVVDFSLNTLRRRPADVDIVDVYILLRRILQGKPAAILSLLQDGAAVGKIVFDSIETHGVSAEGAGGGDGGCVSVAVGLLTTILSDPIYGEQATTRLQELNLLEKVSPFIVPRAPAAAVPTPISQDPLA